MLAIGILDTLCLICLKIRIELKLTSPLAPLTETRHTNCLMGKKVQNNLAN